MPKQDIVEKRILLYDGEEVPGLINIDSINHESDLVDVPGKKKTVPVSNGVKKIASWLVTYKVNANTNTLAFFRDWFENDDQKRVTQQRTDGAGQIIEEIDHGWCQLGSNNLPAFDAAAPTVAQIQALIVPESYDRIQ